MPDIERDMLRYALPLCCAADAADVVYAMPAAAMMLPPPFTLSPIFYAAMMLPMLPMLFFADMLPLADFPQRPLVEAAAFATRCQMFFTLFFTPTS